MQAPGYLSVINGMQKWEAIAYLVKHDMFGISACERFVRHSLLVDNNISFEVGRLSEDFDWAMSVMLAAHSIAGYDSCVYAYRIRSGSISNSFSPKHMDDLLTVVERRTSILSNGNNLDRRTTESLLGYCAYQYCILLGYYESFCEEDKQPFKERLNDLSFLLDCDGGRKLQVVKFFRKLGGKFTYRLMRLYLRWKGKIK